MSQLNNQASHPTWSLSNKANDGKPSAIHFKVTPLDSQGILEVKGVDAQKFLQGQCTTDLTKLAEGQTALGCICNIKGRVLTNFTVTSTKDSLLLKMSKDLLESTEAYLHKYAVFFKVALIQWSNPCLLSFLHALPEALSNIGLPIIYTIGQHNFIELAVSEDNLEQVKNLLVNSDGCQIEHESQWQFQIATAGWLVINAASSNQFLPHHLNFDQLDAISFSKGCYTGQEIIARMHYRGKIKKRLQVLTLNKALSISSYPETIFNGDGADSMGELIFAINNPDTKQSAKSCALVIMAETNKAQGQLTLGKDIYEYKVISMDN